MKKYLTIISAIFVIAVVLSFSGCSNRLDPVKPDEKESVSEPASKAPIIVPDKVDVKDLVKEKVEASTGIEVATYIKAPLTPSDKAAVKQIILNAEITEKEYLPRGISPIFSLTFDDDTTTFVVSDYDYCLTISDDMGGHEYQLLPETAEALKNFAFAKGNKMIADGGSEFASEMRKFKTVYIGDAETPAYEYKNEDLLTLNRSVAEIMSLKKWELDKESKYAYETPENAIIFMKTPEEKSEDSASVMIYEDAENGGLYAQCVLFEGPGGTVTLKAGENYEGSLEEIRNAVVTEAVTSVYKKADEAQRWFNMTSLPSDYEDSKKADGAEYYKVVRFSTMAELEEYISQYFGENIIKDFMSRPNYRDIDGELYTLDGGRGSNIEIGGETYSAEVVSPEKIIFTVTAETLSIDDSGKSTVTGHKDFDFNFEKEDDKWVFTTFPIIR